MSVKRVEKNSFGWSAVIDTRILRLQEGVPKNYSFLLPPVAFVFWGKDYEILEDVNVKLKASFSEGEVIVWGKVYAKLKTACTRCLEDVVFNIEQEFSAVYGMSYPQDLEAEYEISPGEEKYVSVEDIDFIDIGPQVEEAIVLAIPVKILCKDDCKGLCPICGINLNKQECDCLKDAIDPRLEKFKELLTVFKGGAKKNGGSKTEDKQGKKR